MSEQEAIERGWRAVPKWWPLGVAILSAAFSAGTTYATNASTNTYQDQRLGNLEKRMDALESIDSRLSRIEGAMGIQKR